jgi:hypothetical protein
VSCGGGANRGLRRGGLCRRLRFGNGFAVGIRRRLVCHGRRGGPRVRPSRNDVLDPAAAGACAQQQSRQNESSQNAHARIPTTILSMAASRLQWTDIGQAVSGRASCCREKGGEAAQVPHSSKAPSKFRHPRLDNEKTWERRSPHPVYLSPALAGLFLWLMRYPGHAESEPRLGDRRGSGLTTFTGGLQRVCSSLARQKRMSGCMPLSIPALGTLPSHRGRANARRLEGRARCVRPTT